ncbi:MAG: hypothetical protein P8Z76_19485, partial [Alphaproteobacteria bacterium]
CERTPIKATAREPIKQAGYIFATSTTPCPLTCEMQPVHTLGQELTSTMATAKSTFGWKADMPTSFENIC